MPVGEQMAGVFAVTGIFISIITFIVYFFKTRHAERMEMIKNGVQELPSLSKHNKKSYAALKMGLLLLSVGLGLMTGLLIDSALGTEPAATFISILIFGGVSLIFYYYYSEKMDGSNENEEI